MVAFEQHGPLFVRKPVTASIPASRSNFEKKLQAAAGQPSAVADRLPNGCCARLTLEVVIVDGYGGIVEVARQRGPVVERMVDGPGALRRPCSAGLGLPWGRK